MFPVLSPPLIERPKVLHGCDCRAGLAAPAGTGRPLAVPGGGFGLIALGGGLWWLSRPSSSPGFKSPSTVQGWVKRCDAVLDQFDDLEAQTGTPATRLQRQQALDRLIDRREPLSLGVVGSEGVNLPASDLLQQALSGHHALSLCVGHTLPASVTPGCGPMRFRQDALLCLAVAAARLGLCVCRSSNVSPLGWW